MYVTGTYRIPKESWLKISFEDLLLSLAQMPIEQGCHSQLTGFVSYSPGGATVPSLFTRLAAADDELR